jgi:hypothetical protein
VGRAAYPWAGPGLAAAASLNPGPAFELPPAGRLRFRLLLRLLGSLATDSARRLALQHDRAAQSAVHPSESRQGPAQWRAAQPAELQLHVALLRVSTRTLSLGVRTRSRSEARRQGRSTGSSESPGPRPRAELSPSALQQCRLILLPLALGRVDARSAVLARSGAGPGWPLRGGKHEPSRSVNLLRAVGRAGRRQGEGEQSSVCYDRARQRSAITQGDPSHRNRQSVPFLGTKIEPPVCFWVWAPQTRFFLR